MELNPIIVRKCGKNKIYYSPGNHTPIILYHTDEDLIRHFIPINQYGIWNHDHIFKYYENETIFEEKKSKNSKAKDSFMELKKSFGKGKQGRIKVAVYGTLRKGGRFNNQLGDNAVLIESIKLYGYKMFDINGMHPTIIHAKATSSFVICEVYEIDSERMTEMLDVIEGYPDYYNREYIPEFDAWVYFMEPHIFSNISKNTKITFIPDGDYIKFLNKRLSDVKQEEKKEDKKNDTSIKEGFNKFKFKKQITF